MAQRANMDMSDVANAPLETCDDLGHLRLGIDILGAKFLLWSR